MAIFIENAAPGRFYKEVIITGRHYSFAALNSTRDHPSKNIKGNPSSVLIDQLDRSDAVAGFNCEKTWIRVCRSSFLTGSKASFHDAG